jgi:nitrogen regulatory protein PII
VKDYMVIINLHETEFLEETLTALAEFHVRDCIVYTVDGVASHHGTGRAAQSVVLGSIARLFTQDRNINKFIMAVTNETMIDEIKEHLRSFYKEDRWASSFWFVPIEGYHYHKEEF